jgi:hypothetical protein
MQEPTRLDEVTVFSGALVQCFEFSGAQSFCLRRWVLRLSLSVRRAQLLKLAAIGASPLKLRVDLPANQER